MLPSGRSLPEKGDLAWTPSPGPAATLFLSVPHSCGAIEGDLAHPLTILERLSVLCRFLI
jgi:hypothetical protein